jgi:tetratricopeptide (TPR) repeat protein
VAFWRSIKEAWAHRKRSGFRGEEVDCPVPDKTGDCPITEYTKAIASNPNNVPAYLARGAAHLKPSALDSAIADFTKAIELEPNDDSAYINRGSAHYEKAEFDRAIADFTKALEINPRSALAYCNLGWRDNLKLLGASPDG